MNCYFCHKPATELSFCPSHAQKVIYYVHTNTIRFSAFSYTFWLKLDLQQLIINYIPNGHYKETLYKGKIPKDLTPENALSFINRIYNLKTFL